MFDSVVKLLPSATTFMQQIAPSVVATLIAAGLISGYNHTFSGHLTQPRMAALHADEAAPAGPAPQATTVVPMTKPAAGPVTEYITIHERTEPERELEKDPKAEAGKDQTAFKVAVPLPPARPAVPSRTEAFKPEPRVASAPVAAAPAPVQMTVAPMAPPAPARVAVAPAPVAPLAPPPPYAAPPVVVAAPVIVPAEPPPVVIGKPYVTVPDRPSQRPAYEATLDDVPPPPPPRGPFGVIANTLNPASIFARMREFGDKIEQTGNDILPNIRQQ
jgi:hypothetical protein